MLKCTRWDIFSFNFHAYFACLLTLFADLGNFAKLGDELIFLLDFDNLSTLLPPPQVSYCAHLQFEF